MWIDVIANQRLAQRTTPIAGPRQHLLHQHKVGPAHRFIGRAAGTVGFEHLVYHFPQPRAAANARLAFDLPRLWRPPPPREPVGPVGQVLVRIVWALLNRRRL